MATARKADAGFDRQPPQDVEAERSVLGAMLINPEAVGSAIEILRDQPELVFYVEAHQHVYRAMMTLFRKNRPVDVVTLSDQLQREGVFEAVGGASYVADLAQAVPTSANVEHYARIVLETSMLRGLISTCTHIASRAYQKPDDVEELLDRAESEIFSLAEAQQTNPIVRVSELLADSIDRIEQIIKSKTGYTGLPTGFGKLDELMSGMQSSDMIIIAARPSVGKTAFALNIAAHVAIQSQQPALIFSLEMAKEQLTQRLICMEGRIDSQKLRTGFLADREFPKLQQAAARLDSAPIYIDDTPGVSVLELRSKARRHAAQHGCSLLIVDYLQLMRGSSGRAESRQLEIAEISRSIKGLARELRCPVVALSQLSREAERDDSGAPKLSHLRESGAIEQDADVVIMLSRPGASRLQQLEERYGDGVDPNKIIQVDLAKQRNGPTGRIELLFDRNIQHFGDLVGPGEVAPPPSFEQTNRDAEDMLGDDEVPF